ncbi:MAG: hypothetical protein EBV64_13575 [Oxalobacteraceae bacterium]|jgi:hypothetical protein|nr:hypothetical protein [Oxalobacteraceae bacterium]
MNTAFPPELPRAHWLRWIPWALGFCIILFAGFLARGCAFDNRRYEARLQLQHAKNIAEVEQVLGPPIETVGRFEDIHRSHSRDVFTPADEAAGHVLKRYVLWSEVLSFHPGYIELVVKVRPSDGSVLAAKVFYD